MLNPLAIGMTLGGQFLDIVVPRPKLRAGHPLGLSLLSQHAVTRTAPVVRDAHEHVGVPFAGGVS